METKNPTAYTLQEVRRRRNRSHRRKDARNVTEASVSWALLSEVVQLKEKLERYEKSYRTEPCCKVRKSQSKKNVNGSIKTAVLTEVLEVLELV